MCPATSGSDALATLWRGPVSVCLFGQFSSECRLHHARLRVAVTFWMGQQPTLGTMQLEATRHTRQPRFSARARAVALGRNRHDDPLARPALPRCSDVPSLAASAGLCRQPAPLVCATGLPRPVPRRASVVRLLHCLPAGRAARRGPDGSKSSRVILIGAARKSSAK